MDENISCPGNKLMIGSKSQVHYQSLLPLSVTVQTSKIKAQKPEDTIKLQASSSFKADSHSGIELDFPDLMNGQTIESTKALKEKDGEKAFKYKYDGEILIFHFVSDKRVKCPRCGKTFKNIINHCKKGSCRFPKLDELIEEFKQVNNQRQLNNKKDEQRKRKAKSDAKQRKDDDQRVKDNQKEMKGHVRC